MLAAAGAAVASTAGGSPLTQEQATLGGNNVHAAITHERKALKAIKRHRIATALTEAHLGQDSLLAGMHLLRNNDAGQDGVDAYHDSTSADELDSDAIKDLQTANVETGAAQDKALADAKKKLTAAIPLKTKVLTFFESYTPPDTTTSTATPPQAGPLSECVFVTNNGSTSTENVQVRDPNAGGRSGTVTFNGQGVNQTTPFTLDANGSFVVPVLVTTFGTSTITTMVGSQTVSTTFTLDTSTDKTTDHCP